MRSSGALEDVGPCYAVTAPGVTGPVPPLGQDYMSRSAGSLKQEVRWAKDR